ncbi:hypothetical protein ScPMuIL_006961 [Solemya velum]
MSMQLTTGALEGIIRGEVVDKPLLQVISSKKISAASSADRYRLLLSDGQTSYSHAMLATQLNDLMETGEIDNLCVVKVDRYLCNTIQGDRRVMILLEVSVLAKGAEVGGRIGNPQQYKASDGGQSAPAQPKSAPTPTGNLSNKENSNQNPNMGNTASSYGRFSGAGGSTPQSKLNTGPATPGGSTRVHTITSLTPYQNRWRIRARVTQKTGIRTWSNSRGEGKLFSVNLLDESGEIRATGFNDAVDKYYEMMEINKIYYISRGSLKTANKQYTSIQNDYEMSFNNDTVIEPCEEDVELPTLTFDFVQINALESKQPNSMIDIIGIVKTANDISTVTGRQSQKEIKKRDLQLVDQSGMVVNLTLWGNEAEAFDGSGAPVIACKGARLSDYGGRSLSVLASSQLMINPDIREAHILRGWFDREGQNMDFSAYRNEGGSAGAGSSANYKNFSSVKTENLGHGEKPDYFSNKATVIFMKKENCMYKACPTDSCNKKLVDQGNGLYRCEKCAQEFPSFKWRMILQTNVADYADNLWVTCFQDSAETLLGKSAQELGDLRETNEVAFDQVFQEAMFQSYSFRLRCKVETYNDESRLKTICMAATPISWQEYGRRLIDEINKTLQN